MTKTLKERAQEVAELNGKRTRGKWGYDSIDVRDGYYIYTDYPSIMEADYIVCGHKGMGGFNHNENKSNDVKFIAHAPATAQLVADQQERIEELEEEVEAVSAELLYYGHREQR